MGRFLGLRTLWFLLMGLWIQAEKHSVPHGLEVECLGNLVGLSLDGSLLWEHQLEIDAADGSTFVPITERVASQCGFRRRSDPWGNTMLFASIQNCFVEGADDDQIFDLTIRLRLSGSPKSDAVMHTVSKTCPYSAWASREIICNHNYMEVSVRRRIPNVEEFEKELPEYEGFDDGDENRSPLKLWKVQFHTGEAKAMTTEEAHDKGYGLSISSTRALLRSPFNTPESTTVDVSGVPMQLIKASTYLKRKWMMKQLYSAAACPTGGVTFTEEMITWRLPLRISPLLSSDYVHIIEYHMGIQGKRLDASIMAARNYKLTMTDSYFIVEIPVGSVDGYYKSRALDYQYYITYNVEPMLEVLWKEDAMYDDTRYKVLYPIITPPMARPPFIQDNTVPEKRVFDFFVGSFLSDVELVNITFTTGVMSIAEANVQGFNVQEHILPTGLKGYFLQVPFSDPVVHKENTAVDVTDYILPVTFGFVTLPENGPFSHPGMLKASLQDVVLPTVIGTCDLEYFYVTVEYGSQGHNFVTVVGQRELSPDIAEEYGYIHNDTHFSIAVHFLAQDAVFEMVWASLLRSRLNVVLKNPVHGWNLNDFSLSCSFPMTMIECFSNGTMTALAVKVESVPDLILSQLTLRDSRCKPAYSDHIFAFFSFSLNSCGTTRKFINNYMIYENEVSLGSQKVTTAADQYLITVSCYYGINATYTLPFSTMPNPEPVVHAALGVFMVGMQLALDSSYSVFYLDEHYPVVKYLREPLYFEVELMRTTDPQVELFLENCWATTEEERTSVPKWDIIVDGCENLADPYHTIFHGVSADARVHFRSHFKRFEVKMFSFTLDGVALKGQIFVHCDVVICDVNSPTDSLCSRACMNNQNMSTASKRVRRSTENTHMEQVSSGPIVLI
ncbi:zona pellucida protein AX 1 [Anguilla rostrata]|uniref:zona pellucida protein AX 1 n=1 Tax=Anguilla rostrata TaxID=7938 RepID=UPI0030D19AA2